MDRVDDMVPVLLINMLAIAINFSEFSPMTQCFCTITAGVYTVVKTVEAINNLRK
jgi:hypothetical protein